MRLPVAATLSGLAAATLAIALFAAPSPGYGQAGHGPTTDWVTGWRCLHAACDTIIEPRTQCLCRKDNPNETDASRLRLTCIGKSRNDSCAATTRVRGR